jgi:beta-catenin-like protein 1
MLVRGEEVTADDEDEFYLKRLSGGLFQLQQIELLMVEVSAACTPDVKQKILDLLNLRGGNIKQVRNILRGIEFVLQNSIGFEDW